MKSVKYSASLPQPFASTTALQQAYAEGLTRLLAGDVGLGGYILALANTAQDATLWQLLERRLEERHYHLAALVTTRLRQGRPIGVPDDDLMVFLKLMAIGFSDGLRVHTRRVGPWEVSFNPLRALRPPRASRVRVEGLSRPFDPEGFHFNRPALEREVLWSGTLLGRPARLLYNKFPFVELHGLLVPEPEQSWPQWLTEQWHDWAWALAAAAGEAMPGFGLAYNSLGAHASVNHLHFQTFVRTVPLPLEQGHWRHNRGEIAYPTTCLTFGDAGQAWQAIASLHSQGTPYNMIYTAGRLYLLPRRPQGSHPQAEWASGHAWYEMAGGVVLFNRADYEGLDAEAIAVELQRVGQV
ncbi:MAG: hypothetical protein ACK4TK_00330 [Thiobacillaceae bacterium]